MEGYSTSVSEDGKVRLEVGLVRDAKEKTEGSLHIRVTALDEPKRSAVNVLCLIDCSASMADKAFIQNADGTREATGLNLLDLARHAVATLAHGLSERDMLGIIGWSTTPDKEMTLRPMNEKGKKDADDTLKKLYPFGGTGLIEVLQRAFDLLIDNGNPTVIFLLTDGLPNKKPPEGFHAMVRDLMEKTKLPVQINTLGFGYGVDSVLLTDIAESGHGTFSFIPDSGMLGTVVVNGLANTVSVALSNTQVSVDLCDGISFAEKALDFPKGSMELPAVNADGSVCYCIGAVNYEQPRSVVIPVVISADFAAGTAPVASVSVFCNISGRQINTSIEDAVTQVLPSMRLSYSMAAAAIAKTIFADYLFEIIHMNPSTIEEKEMIATSTEHMKACSAKIKKLLEVVGSNKQISDILIDCEGQATEALSKIEWFRRWGRHYLRSLCGAHEFELCNNFRDPGVQHYGGALFASVRDDLDDIFQGLPAPEHHPYVNPNAGARYTAVRDVSFTMSRFMDVTSGCFAGSCSVTMADGTKKLVSEVHKGDVIRTGCESEPIATVITSIQTSVAAKSDVYELSPSKLIITAWHPVDIEGKNEWSFPINCASSSRKQSSEPLFTFVLDKVHSVLVNDIRCVTLAHGILSGSDARAHPYFGSKKCIEDLQKNFPKDYSSGRVILPPNCTFTRDPSTSLINGIALY